jgi:trehalose/maltose hydrolase-like predicted phosphorylase
MILGNLLVYGVPRRYAAYFFRYRTMPAALAHAKSVGLNGTKWSWESAFSGTTATGGDNQEIHLQAGIGIAIRSYFRSTHDLVWLKETAWPMLQNIVRFFESRASPAPSSTTQCSAGKLCLALDKVESPNEYASGINNDIYTNAAFAALIQWVGVAAELLGEADANQYFGLAARILIPFNHSRNRHIE